MLLGTVLVHSAHLAKRPVRSGVGTTMSASAMPKQITQHGLPSLSWALAAWPHFIIGVGVLGVFIKPFNGVMLPT